MLADAVSRRYIPHHVIAVGEEQPHSNMTWQLQKIASENDVIFLCDANLFLVSVLWRSDDGLTTTTSDGGVSRFPVILNPHTNVGFPFGAGVRKERHVSHVSQLTAEERRPRTLPYCHFIGRYDCTTLCGVLSGAWPFYVASYVAFRTDHIWCPN